MRQFLVATMMACALCGTASAALDTSNVYTDASGPWTGTVTMTKHVGSLLLEADIQWCVDSPVLHGGEEQFQYNYQITSLGNDPLTLLAVTLLSNNGAVDIGSAPAETGDVAPSAAYFHGLLTDYGTANWTFPGGLLNGDVSNDLYFWSANAPIQTPDPSLIQDHGLFAVGTLPSPSSVIPEPATMGTLALGLAALLRRCIRSRRSGRKGSVPGAAAGPGV